VYASGDPVNHLDPTGRFSIGETLVSLAVGGSLLVLSSQAAKHGYTTASRVLFAASLLSGFGIGLARGLLAGGGGALVEATVEGALVSAPQAGATVAADLFAQSLANRFLGSLTTILARQAAGEVVAVTTAGGVRGTLQGVFQYVGENLTKVGIEASAESVKRAALMIIFERLPLVADRFAASSPAVQGEIIKVIDFLAPIVYEGGPLPWWL
jgi:hypothetical protein